MHAINLASMIALLVSGLYIHRPFFAGGMAAMRQVHFFAMYVVLANLAVRVYWAFMGKGSSAVKGGEKAADWRNFWFGQRENKGQLFEVVKYYLFLRKTHPRTGKYNPLQKMTYFFWGPLLIVQGVTGFAIYKGKVFGLVDAQNLFAGLNSMVGGLMVMRTIHYAIMWVFIVTVAFHVYLSLAEDFSAFKLMFSGAETEEEH